VCLRGADIVTEQPCHVRHQRRAHRRKTVPLRFVLRHRPQLLLIHHRDGHAVDEVRAPGPGLRSRDVSRLSIRQSDRPHGLAGLPRGGVGFHPFLYLYICYTPTTGTCEGRENVKRAPFFDCQTAPGSPAPICPIKGTRWWGEPPCNAFTTLKPRRRAYFQQ